MSTPIDKKSLSERDICTKFITPAIGQANWDVQMQMREEVSFTKGRILVRGKTTSRGESRRADYILYVKPNIAIAIIEAKDNHHPVGGGMQQALLYGEMLDIPFVYSSNGDAFLEHDRTGIGTIVERELPLDAFPSPDELWQRYCAWKGISHGEQEVILQDYYDDGSGREPRYYQQIAINRTVEAIAKGSDRILLVMATGTGKTYTAFQIIWRLWKSKTRKRILFLADRNILIDQARINDFKPFGTAMTKISGRKVDKSYEIYLALYQAVSGTEASQNIYREFSPDFFDLIVVDECHRGSAKADSAWREILEYFKGATQIGLTATPKETASVSNIDYFGEPIYTYSLRQGIEDGFLAPYKVVRVDFDKDLQGYRPTAGERDKYGHEIEDRIYNQRDINKKLVLAERDRLVARKISDYLRGTDRYAKTIVFCEDIEHAGRMRQALVNENADLAAVNARYVMQITGDNDEGKAELDNFILPGSRYPVIATTSKLLTTGVDAQTCKLIVLDQRIESMTEFKQIIGRGTRVREDFDKLYFTIIDFKKATELFADPDFDGDPVQIYEITGDESPVPPDEIDEGGEGSVEDDGVEIPTEIGGAWDGSSGKPRKYYLDNVAVSVMAERVQYYNADGALMTESLKDFTRQRVRTRYETLDDFLTLWSAADRKQAVIDAMEEQGIFLDALADDVGRDYDPFDLICHVAFDQPPLTRRERADRVRKRNYFTRYDEQARAVLDALLDKYATSGIERIEDMNELKTAPINRIGTVSEIVTGVFGGKENYLRAVRELEAQLYGAS